MAGDAGAILCLAAEICIVLGSQVVNPQDGFVSPELRDGDPERVRTPPFGAGRNGRRPVLYRNAVSEPTEGHGEVALRGRAQHGHSLAQFQMFVHREGIQLWRHCKYSLGVCVLGQLCSRTQVGDSKHSR